MRFGIIKFWFSAYLVIPISDWIFLSARRGIRLLPGVLPRVVFGQRGGLRAGGGGEIGFARGEFARAEGNVGYVG